MCIAIYGEFHGLDLSLNDNKKSKSWNRTMRCIAARQFFCLFSLLWCFTHYLAWFIQSSKLPSDAAQNIEKSEVSAKAKEKKDRSESLTLTYFVVNILMFLLVNIQILFASNMTLRVIKEWYKSDKIGLIYWSIPEKSKQG